VSIWTVDTWRVAPGREAHFLEHCGKLSPDDLILYRDVNEEGIFWSPAKWASLEALMKWRDSGEYASAVRLVAEDVIDHEIHVMTEVAGFGPRESGSSE
jgi:hypothetical protein